MYRKILAAYALKIIILISWMMLCDSKMCRRYCIASNVRILRLFMSALVSSFVPRSLHSFQFVDVFSGVTCCMLAIQSSSDHNTF